MPTGAIEVSRIRSALTDRYRIERVLGEGGMATVYLAEDLKHRRKAAVKVMWPDSTTTANTVRIAYLPSYWMDLGDGGTSGIIGALIGGQFQKRGG